MSQHTSPSFYLVTLGCKVNQYESQALAEAWRQAGFCRVDDSAQADVAVLFSCVVTARAEAESRRLARNLARQIKPDGHVVVTGCASVVAPAAFTALGTTPVPDKAALAHQPRGPYTTAPRSPKSFPDLAIAGYDRARALVKIQDGCSHGCSYCIVPAARGASVSRPFPDILAEIERLAQGGHREIGLTGINLGHYGRDLDHPRDFWALLAALEDALAPRYANTIRLRLGSLDPSMLTEQGAAFLKHSRLVCHHLHISLQSAAPNILTAMRRRPDDAERVSSFVDSVSREWTSLGLGLDILTGFPGESETDFAQTDAFLDRVPLTYAHVFPYSRRPGTLAAGLPGHLPRQVKSDRARILREKAEAKSLRFLDRLQQKSALVVAVERLSPPAVGTCDQYVDCRFEVPPNAPTGTLVRVRPVGIEPPFVLVATAPEEVRP